MVYYKKKRNSTRNQLGDFKNHVDRNPVPLYSFREFSYSLYYFITTANGQNWSASQDFGLNRLYDPSFGATTDSVLGFDQFFPALYRRFKVYSTRVTVNFYDPSEDGITVCAYVTNASNPTYTLTNLPREDAAAAPYATTRVISNTGAQRVSLSGRFPMHVVYNNTPDQFKYDNDNTTGSFSGDPLLAPRFKICAASGSASTTATVRYKITFSYWAMCYDRTNLVIS